MMQQHLCKKSTDRDLMPFSKRDASLQYSINEQCMPKRSFTRHGSKTGRISAYTAVDFKSRVKVCQPE